MIRVYNYLFVRKCVYDTINQGDQMKILFVDDEPEITETLGDYISKSVKDVSVFKINKESDALDFILYEKPNLVVSDFNMPSMTGVELLEKSHESLKDQCPKFIFFTANPGLVDISHKLSPFALEIYSKLTDVEKLKVTIENFKSTI